MNDERQQVEIAVECIDCGQPVCVHQQAVIRRFEAELEAERGLRKEAERGT